MKVKFNRDVTFSDNGQFKLAKVGEVFDLPESVALSLGDACSPLVQAKVEVKEEALEAPKKSSHSNKAVLRAPENK